MQARRLQQYELSLGQDAKAWADWVVSWAREFLSRNACVTPSDLRAACDQFDRRPPHQNHWGLVWNRLRDLGLERQDESVISRTPTRNAAREPVWVAGPRWDRRRTT